MTESDAKSVEFMRFVRLLRELLRECGVSVDLFAVDALARGYVDQLINRFVPTNAPRGDVGRYPNADIAEALGWHGDADRFVAALVGSGRLLEHPEYRLIVANWEKLAPAYLRSNIKHAGGFLSVSDSDNRNGDRSQERNGERSENRNDGLRSTVLSNPSLPSLSNSSPPPPILDPIDDSDGSSVFGGDQMFVDEATLQGALPIAKEVADLVRIGSSPLSPKDVEDILRRVIVAQRRLPGGELAAIIRRVRKRIRDGGVKSRIGLFNKSVENACRDAGIDYHFISKFDLPRRVPCESQIAEVIVA